MSIMPFSCCLIHSLNLSHSLLLTLCLFFLFLFSRMRSLPSHWFQWIARARIVMQCINIYLRILKIKCVRRRRLRRWGIFSFAKKKKQFTFVVFLLLLRLKSTMNASKLSIRFCFFFAWFLRFKMFMNIFRQSFCFQFNFHTHNSIAQSAKYTICFFFWLSITTKVTKNFQWRFFFRTTSIFVVSFTKNFRLFARLSNQVSWEKSVKLNWLKLFSGCFVSFSWVPTPLASVCVCDSPKVRIKTLLRKRETEPNQRQYRLNTMWTAQCTKHDWRLASNEIENL